MIQFHNSGAEEVKFSINQGLFKRFQIASDVEKQRIILAQTPVLADLSTEEKSNEGLQKWQEFWNSMQMVLLSYLTPNFQKSGKNQPCGRMDPGIFEYVMQNAGGKRFISTPSRRKQMHVMVQYTLTDDLPFFKENVPEKADKAWVNIAPETFVPIMTRKRFTKLVLRQSVATELLEFDYSYVNEVYNASQEKWIATI